MAKETVASETRETINLASVTSFVGKINILLFCLDAVKMTGDNISESALTTVKCMYMKGVVFINICGQNFQWLLF